MLILVDCPRMLAVVPEYLKELNVNKQGKSCLFGWGNPELNT